MKVIKYKCAICDKEYDNIPEGAITFKVKKVVPVDYTVGKIKKEVLICPDCQKKIKGMVKNYETD